MNISAVIIFKKSKNMLCLLMWIFFNISEQCFLNNAC